MSAAVAWQATTLGVVGRYLLSNSIFRHLRELKPGSGGEALRPNRQKNSSQRHGVCETMKLERVGRAVRSGPFVGVAPRGLPNASAARPWALRRYVAGC